MQKALIPQKISTIIFQIIRKKNLHYGLVSIALVLGLYAAQNTQALRWIYLKFSERAVTVGSQRVNLTDDFYMPRGNEDPTIQNVAGFYTDKELYPADAVVLIHKPLTLENATLEILDKKCRASKCELVGRPKIQNIECTMHSWPAGFGASTATLTITCPAPTLGIVVSYNGTKDLLKFFLPMLSKILAAVEVETKSQNARFSGRS